jgi:hypothetical protein
LRYHPGCLCWCLGHQRCLLCSLLLAQVGHLLEYLELC